MTDHLQRYIKALLVLLLIGLTERTLFALHHGSLTETLTLGEVGYALIWGLRYDAAIASVFAFLALAAAHLIFRLSPASFATTMRWCTYPAAVGLIALHGSDLLYFGDAGRHMGYELRDAYTSGGELFAAALGSYTGPVLLQLALMIPALWLVKRLLAGTGEPERPRGWRRLMPEAQLVGALLLTGLLARGGVQGVPLEPLHAQELGDAQQAAIALNGAYNALFSTATPYSTERVMKEEPTPADRRTVRSLYAGSPEQATGGEARDYNVVFLFLESWSGAFVSSYGHELPTTPVFDRLRREGLSAQAMLAGGRRTTEGMFASLCSAQNPLGNTVAQGQLQNYSYHCLPRLLRESGYETAFFQGTISGTSGTGAFAQLLGFERSYGREHMDMDALRYERNSWGVHDPDLYDFAIEKMRSMPAPFLVGINTNSTHDAVLPEGVEPRFDVDRDHATHLNTLHFADRALGEFIEKVKQTEGIGPTLFVLVADHTGPNLGSGYYNFLIPFAVVGPGVAAQEAPAAASQRDIAPTLLELLGRPVPDWFTGQSLLRTDPDRHFADFYRAGELGWLQGDLLQLIPLSARGQAACFDYQTDPWLTEAITCPPRAEEQRRNALAFTRTAQHLLFEGQLEAFAEVRANTVE